MLSALINLLGWTELRAQAQRGTTYWGGTVRLDGTSSRTKDLDVNSNSSIAQHRIMPEIQWGKFVNPTTMIGLGIAYDLSWTRRLYSDASGASKVKISRSVSQSVAVLPFVRKYKFVNKHWAVFLHGEIGPTFGAQAYKSDIVPSQNQRKNYTFYHLGIKPGLVYSFPNKKLSIEGYFNLLSVYARYAPLLEEADQARDFLLSTGLSTSFPSFFNIRLAKNINAKTTHP